MLVAERFIRSLVSIYGKHTVYTDGSTWYPEACIILRVKHYLHSSLRKVWLIERVNQYFKDGTKSFDDYYPCIQNECTLFHIYNRIEVCVSMYNNTTSQKKYFINEL
jgi:putative transposase